MNVKTGMYPLPWRLTSSSEGRSPPAATIVFSEVVRAALRLLEEQERRRGTFAYEQIADRQPNAR
jgi:Bacterial antitoxin of ParD toxin-antitoxin type II system and RHH